MPQIEVAIAVAGVSEPLERELAEAGLRVVRRPHVTRVVASFEAMGENSIRAHAHATALDLADEYGLQLLDVTGMVLRDPRGDEDIRPDLLIAEPHEIREREEPRPRKRGWLERIGLGGAPDRDDMIVYWERRPLDEAWERPPRD